jgi:hypothetical protein
MGEIKIGKNDKVEKLAGRELVIPADGGKHFWKDTGEICTPDERAFYAEVATTEDKAFDFKGQQVQNPDLLFYAMEIAKEPGTKPVSNPIRGIPVEMFRRPANFTTANDEGEDEEASDKKPNVACFMLLTAPCYVKGRGKIVRKANPGEMVWVDLNQATNKVVTIAMPKKGPDGKLCAVAEVAIDPGFKEPYTHTFPNGKTETRNAWRAKVFGGFNGGVEFKKYLSAEEIAKKLGSRVATPSLLSEEDIDRALGIALPAAPEAPQLPAST